MSTYKKKFGKKKNKKRVSIKQNDPIFIGGVNQDSSNFCLVKNFISKIKEDTDTDSEKTGLLNDVDAQFVQNVNASLEYITGSQAFTTFKENESSGKKSKFELPVLNDSTRPTAEEVADFFNNIQVDIIEEPDIPQESTSLEQARSRPHSFWPRGRRMRETLKPGEQNQDNKTMYQKIKIPNFNNTDSLGIKTSKDINDNVIVTEVTPNGLAYTNGIKVGDIILTLNGESINNKPVEQEDPGQEDQGMTRGGGLFRKSSSVAPLPAEESSSVQEKDNFAKSFETLKNSIAEDENKTIEIVVERKEDIEYHVDLDGKLKTKSEFDEKLWPVSSRYCIVEKQEYYNEMLKKSGLNDKRDTRTNKDIIAKTLRFNKRNLPTQDFPLKEENGILVFSENKKAKATERFGTETFLVGDIIVNINGTVVESLTQCQNILQKIPNNDEEQIMNVIRSRSGFQRAADKIGSQGDNSSDEDKLKKMKCLMAALKPPKTDFKELAPEAMKKPNSDNLTDFTKITDETREKIFKKITTKKIIVEENSSNFEKLEVSEHKVNEKLVGYKITKVTDEVTKLQTNDVIVAIDGERVPGTVQDFKKLLKNYPINKTATFSVFKNNMDSVIKDQVSAIENGSEPQSGQDVPSRTQRHSSVRGRSKIDPMASRDAQSRDAQSTDAPSQAQQSQAQQSQAQQLSTPVLSATDPFPSSSPKKQYLPSLNPRKIMQKRGLPVEFGPALAEGALAESAGVNSTGAQSRAQQLSTPVLSATDPFPSSSPKKQYLPSLNPRKIMQKRAAKEEAAAAAAAKVAAERAAARQQRKSDSSPVNRVPGNVTRLTGVEDPKVAAERAAARQQRKSESSPVNGVPRGIQRLGGSGGGKKTIRRKKSKKNKKQKKNKKSTKKKKVKRKKYSLKR